MRNKQKGFTLLGLIFIGIWIFGIVSWVTNLVELVNCDFEAPYKAEIVHGIGLIGPVSMVTAWINVGK